MPFLRRLPQVPLIALAAIVILSLTHSGQAQAEDPPSPEAAATAATPPTQPTPTPAASPDPASGAGKLKHLDNKEKLEFAKLQLKANPIMQQLQAINQQWQAVQNEWAAKVSEMQKKYKCAGCTLNQDLDLVEAPPAEKKEVTNLYTIQAWKKDGDGRRQVELELTVEERIVQVDAETVDLFQIITKVKETAVGVVEGKPDHWPNS